MSKQVGLFRMDGKIGGVSFYRSAGVDLARIANGPSKEKIASDPNFRRTRENNTEFGGCASVVKALRLAIGEARITKADAQIVGRLMKIFKEINLAGTGARGQRGIDLVDNDMLLQGFEFNSRTALSSIFTAPYGITTTAARNEATVTAAAFLPASFINYPDGATHFKVFATLCTLSNYAYDVDTGKYMATDPTLDMLNAEDDSGVLDLSSTVPVSLSLNPVLAGAPTMTATVAAVLLIGCEFYQRVGSVDYLLAQGDCMRAVRVF
jgi:hypothetical protein